ncbi:hypothetical protein [Streptomyces nanshensis]|nr:hypothetical protein [Streptomyces nanshensis]
MTKLPATTPAANGFVSPSADEDLEDYRKAEEQRRLQPHRRRGLG